MSLTLTTGRVGPTAEVLEFDCGVRAYPPARPDGYWRLRWVEEGTVATPPPAPATRPWPRRPSWWREQEAYCRRFVAPVIAEVELRQLSRCHFARVLAAAPTPSVVSHLRRCLTAMVAAGLEEGLLLTTQDVLRGVHWRDPATEGDRLDTEEEGRFVDEADIPTASAVHALAAAAGERVWWRELQVLAVAHSGLRWGEWPPSPPIASMWPGGACSSTARWWRAATASPWPRPRTAARAPPCTRPARPGERSWGRCWSAA